MDNEKIDLSLIIGRVKLTNLLKGKLAEFCPVIYACQKQGIDANCFYEKFLHCNQVDKLGLGSKLSSEDIQNRKIYKLEMTDNINNINNIDKDK